MKHLCKLALIAVFACSASVAAHATLLLQYDPKGAQVSDTAVSPINLAANIGASDLSVNGLIKGYGNNGVLPVGLITTSPTIQLDEYVTFSMAVSPGYEIRLQNLYYDKLSYFNSGGSFAAVRSSLDGYASNIALLSVNPSGYQSLDFDLSASPLVSSAISLRIYFYASPNAGQGWDDLASTDRPGQNGLRLEGLVVAVPEASPSGLLIGGLPCILAILGIRARREREVTPGPGPSFGRPR